MDLFDVHRRDVYNFDQYMDLKKPGFGGNDSLIYGRDASGKETSKSDKLKGYRKVVKRDPIFKSSHYNSTYKAMSHDLVYKQEGQKPVTYPDPYLTGVATVEVGKYKTEKANESRANKFLKSINEGTGLTGSVKKTIDINENIEKAMKREKSKLEALKREISKNIAEGKCHSFDQFSLIREQYGYEYETAEPETEEEIDIDTEEYEGPENPPKRRINPAPKNVGNLENAIQDLMNYMDISREEAERILAIDVIRDLETAEPETEEEIDIDTEEYEGPENPPKRRINPAPKNKYDELDDIIDTYGEGPGCGLN
jgi:hypothetical protein